MKPKSLVETVLEKRSRSMERGVPQPTLPGLEAAPGEPIAPSDFRVAAGLEMDAETYDKLTEYAELRGIALKIACQEVMKRFFAERPSGVDAMLRHDAAVDGWQQKADWDSENEW